jgi:hypothetical protein
MSEQQYSNLASSTLASVYTAGDTTLTLQSGTGSLFPVTGDFTVAIDSPPSFFLYCTARATDVITVNSSASEGTTAGNKPIGTTVTEVITAGVLNNIRNDMNKFGFDTSISSSGMHLGDRYDSIDQPYYYIYGTSGWRQFTSGTGSSGTSGVSGTSGTSGVSGSSGTSALGFTSGTSGISGSSGTSGIGGGSIIHPSPLIPVMVSNTAPYGIASASSTYMSGIPDGISTGWLQYEFPFAVIATNYAILPWSVDNWNSRVPTAWTFEGSNDGIDWTTLDTQSISASIWVQYCWIFFSIPNTTAYSYYRLNITANNGDTYLGVSGFQIYG